MGCEFGETCLLDARDEAWQLLNEDIEPTTLTSKTAAHIEPDRPLVLSLQSEIFDSDGPKKLGKI